MVELSQHTLNIDREDDALSMILEGTAKVTGEAFFAALVENLSKALDTHSAWVTEYIEETRQLRALAFWADGKLLTDFIIDQDGTPCGDVIEHAEFIHHTKNIVNVYPKDFLLKQLKAVSYMGVPLWGTEQKVLGHLAVLDTRPLPEEPRTLKIFQIFAARASGELQRIRVEQDIRKREEKYRRIVETAREGFILLDRNYKIMDVNEMYCKMTGFRREEIIGKTPLDFSPDNHKDFLMTMFYISIDVENKNLSWVRAGHDPAIIYDPSLDRFEELSGAGLALGIDDSYIFEENTKTGLSQGQIIAIGTDGIWETFNKDGEMFGKHRYREIIRKNAHMQSNDIIDAIYHEIDTFSKGVKQEDDITLVIIKLEGTSRKGGDWQI